MKGKCTNANKNKVLEIVALVIALMSLTLGFLALSNQIKIQSELTVHNDELKFNVVFSFGRK